MSWRERAACLEAPTDLFFPDVGKTPHEARAYCARCEVTAECVAFAIETNSESGIWGGLSRDQRRRISAQGRNHIQERSVSDDDSRRLVNR
jgi:WhiB family transcriptional regulator, redox-sensing transcriptional regulator